MKAGVEEAYREARLASRNERRASNPLANPLFSSLLKAAIKSLKVVAMATFAYEIAVAVQMLERYIQDRESDLSDEQGATPPPMF